MIFVTLCVLGSNSVVAALSSASHPVFGEAALTVDSEQRLAWLTPNATVGLSFVDVRNLLMSDSRFSGFRVATMIELEALYSHAFIPDINVPGYGAFYGTSENVPGALYLQSLTGVTYSAEIGGLSLFETAGFVGNSFVNPINGFLTVALGDVVVRTDVRTAFGTASFASAYTTLTSVLIGTNYEGVGAWLVSAVPEPNSGALVILAVVALTFIVRRR